MFADCAHHISPTEQELAKIGVVTADCAKEMGITPHIAFLSFSTNGSADHEHVHKIRTATELAKKLAPHYSIEGELQFDSAFNAEIAAIKSHDKSKIHKTANIFIFPDLNSGNIAYKVAAHMGGSVAIGPILHGFSHPVSDLSRGCKVEDIVNAVAVIASQVKKKN
jgi:phosphate acetyltransferase